MERKKSTPAESQKPKWKKITRGTLYPFPNRRNVRVKPNEVIQATAEELAKVADHFELVKEGTGIYSTSTVEKKPKKKGKVPTEVYELIPIGEGLYNVLSPGDKVMNESGLKREDAEALKKKLETESIEE